MTDQNDFEIPQQLFVGLQAGKNYGWGVCSGYLITELAKLIPVHILNDGDGTDQNPNLPGKLFQALRNVNFFPLFENARGRENYGYTFFENELTAYSLENAAKYTQVIAGSAWCRDRLREKGINNSDVLIQGIDPQKFFPVSHRKPSKNFVIFSGGKFELRKGQDLVLKAFKILQDKYDDIILVNCWCNLWPESIQLMASSPHIKLPNSQLDSWKHFMQSVYQINGLDSSRIITYDLVPNYHLRGIYGCTDIGVFPNRCEGGTNLVMMEYMACAKPVIASNTSGHRDIVTNQNALLLNYLNNFHLHDKNNKLIGRWQEPSLDELINTIEYAYHNRDVIQQIGQQAGEDLQHLTWAHTATHLLGILGLGDKHAV